MKGLLLFCLAMFLFHVVLGQSLSLSTILETTDIQQKNFDKFLSKKGFAYVGNTYHKDTIIREYYYGGKEKTTDSIRTSFKVYKTSSRIYFAYSTTAEAECGELKNKLRKEGFFCNAEQISLKSKLLMYQKNDVSVLISSKQVDTLTEYSFLVRKADLPDPEDIEFAEDLCVFDSHEYLRFYFGDRNVKKDIYYLSDNEIVKCSVLFPNTNRQAVFLWVDAVNDCGLSYIYIGGQLMTKSSLLYDKNVAENIWQLKSGIYAGMSIYSLRQLNDAAFNFNGGKSVKTGMVLTDSSGKLDFKKEHIFLGCMNCDDRDFLEQSVMNSDDAIMDKRILFVQTIVLDAAIIEQAKRYRK